MQAPFALVLGTGGAGLRAALELRRAGLPVIVMSKGGAGVSGSTPSGVFSYCCARPGDPSYPPELFREDLLRSGQTVNDPELVDLMVRDGFRRLEELTEMGMPWTRTPTGELALARVPGHRASRAFHADNRTGRAMSDTLLRACLGEGVQFQQYQIALDLLLEGDTVAGVAVLDLVNGEATALPCDALVIACGGAAGLYRLHSNPPGQTGDGMAVLLRAGGELADMEFMQSYPTVLVHPPAAYGNQLVTDVILSEGARLLDRNGQEFFNRWEKGSPGEATRDVLARAIAREIAAGGGTEAGGVYLDARGIPAGAERDRYDRYLKELGVDPNESVQQVAPGAHYSLGGVRIESSTACQGVAGVFAGGEVAAGVHGANRLPGNALPETQVFGAAAGTAAVRWMGRPRGTKAPSGADRRPLRRGESAVWDALGEARARDSGVRLEDLQASLRDTMQRHVSVVRSGPGLEWAMARIQELRQLFFSDLTLPSREGCWHPELLEAVQTANMLEVALAMVASALARTESRGAHFREDCPERKEEWNHNNLIVRGTGESMAVHRRDRGSGEERQVWP